ncbi:MAG: leucine-rich repeat protein [Muribaculaceae bacterium]|nr:leucine-rich repeat protein [Muribaculaceae bacterium]
MKRIVHFLFIMSAVLTSLPTLAYNGQNFSYQGVNYTVISESEKTVKTKVGDPDGTWDLAGNNFKGALVLPEKVYNGSIEYTLVEIGEYSFHYNFELTSVSFPSTLKKISRGAFWEADKIQEVDLSNTVVTDIAEASFHGKIKTVRLPKTLETAGSDFSDLYSIVISSGGVDMVDLHIPDIESYCNISGNIVNCSGHPIRLFEHGKEVIDLEIPQGITRIHSNRFYSMRNIRSVSIPTSVKTIGDYAFMSTGITSVIIPDNVVSLGDYGSAFSDCPLKEFTIGNGVTGMVSLDTKNDYLEKLVIGNSITEMYFGPMPNLKEIVIGSSLANLTNFDLRSSKNLMSVTCLNVDVITNYSSSFSMETKQNGFLYIPSSAYEKVKSTSGFRYVIPLGDISGAFSSDTQNLGKNKEITFPVNLTLNPTVDYAGFQFDIQAPEGITIRSIQLSDELTGFSSTTQQKANNTTRFMAYTATQQFSNISKNTVNVTIKADNSVASGIQQLKITNATATRVDAVDIVLDNSDINIKINIPVQTVTLTPATAVMHKEEQSTFTMTYDPANAEDHEFTWETSENLEIISSNASSITVKAKDYGMAQVKVVYASDPAIYATADINIVDYLQIVSARNSFKETETEQLTAKWTNLSTNIFELPTDLEWTSSAPQYATVGASTGLVKGVSEGSAVITVASKATPEINASFNITIEKRILGDANDNKVVNVADVVAIANNIADYPVYNFCFVNADTDDSGEITTADLTKTVNIILQDDDYQPNSTNAKRIAPAMNPEDYLVSDNFNANIADKFNIDVRIQGSNEYVALQATMIVPHGMTVHEIVAGPSAINHSLIYNIKDNNSVKIVLFSLNNQSFVNAALPLFTIIASVDTDCGNIEFSNILGSNAQSQEFALGYTGGINTADTSGIGNAVNAAATVKVVSGGVEIYGASGSVYVYNSMGEVVKVVAYPSSCEFTPLATGFYVVTVDNAAYKIAVK